MSYRRRERTVSRLLGEHDPLPGHRALPPLAGRGVGGGPHQMSEGRPRRSGPASGNRRSEGVVERALLMRNNING
ncbi:hypothetical protein [Streptomyces sp. NPDC058698]|uniref:hypothetical protein n=1 Tax=Streptomyces sp. NPDC058698 TaxID=3346606 RepID=UPI003655A3D3